MISEGFHSAVKDSGVQIESQQHVAEFDSLGGYFFAQRMIQMSGPTAGGHHL